MPQKRSREQAANDTVPKKVARLEAEEKLPETIAKENKMLEEKIQIRDQFIETLKIKLQKKDQYIAKQKENMQLKDEIIAKKNTDIELLKASKILKRSRVPAPPPVPIPFSSIVSFLFFGIHRFRFRIYDRTFYMNHNTSKYQ